MGPEGKNVKCEAVQRPVLVMLATLFTALAVGLTAVGCFPSFTPVQDPNKQTTQRPLGCNIPSPNEIAKMPKAIHFGRGATALPTSVDLTTSGRVPPVGDQVRCGSCVAFACGYLLASYHAAGVNSWSPTTMAHQGSPAYLLEKAHDIDEKNYGQRPACCDGTWETSALDHLVKVGCASLQSVPYTQDQQAGQSCPSNPADGDAAYFRIGSYKTLDAKDRNGIKSELASGHPIPFSGLVSDEFMNLQGSAVFTSMTVGPQNAGHCMTVVGYDDAKGAYRVQNSWGTGWGDNGYLWWGYESWENFSDPKNGGGGGFSAEPPANAPTPEPNAEPNTTPTPEPNNAAPPVGYLDQAFQYPQADYMTGLTYTYLIFQYHFSAPLFIKTVQVVDPFGAPGYQTYNQWYSAGYVYFVSWPGYVWYPGNYYITFYATTQAGQDVTYQGVAYIQPLPYGTAKAKVVEFRNMKISLSTGDAKLPEMGVKPGILGMNRQPAVVPEQ